MIAKRSKRWLVPEVVQTSAMDCGPAALRSLLAGFDIPVSYERLREACQTDVDGTCIDSLEAITNRLGLEAEQIMLPPDHLSLAESKALPAIVVVRHPSGAAHFVVAWRRVGPWFMLMDPAVGRRWVTTSELRRELYVHALAVDSAALRAWVESREFLEPLEKRIAQLGAARCARALTKTALTDPGVGSIAALDAATRLVARLVAADGVERGHDARALLERLFERARTERTAIPDADWSMLPHDGGDSEARVLLSGAVLVRARRPETMARDSMAPNMAPPNVSDAAGAPSEAAASIAGAGPLELRRALGARSARPNRELIRLLAADGALAPATVLVAACAAAFATAIEALVLRSLLDVGRTLTLVPQRLAGVAALLLLCVISLTLEFPLTRSIACMGRRLEARLRLTLCHRLPRLPDRYFRSRPISDMAERGHGLHALRQLPEFGARATRALLDLAITCGAIAWVDPPSLWPALGIALGMVAIAVLAEPALSERDLRVRVHSGAMMRFFLDALLGLVPVRTHGAERSLLREHEGLLVDWVRAARAFSRTALSTEAAQALLASTLTALLLMSHVEREQEPAALLLLLYWALNLRVVGEEFTGLMRQYPALRNRTLRLLEPLAAAVSDPQGGATTPSSPLPSCLRRQGMAIDFDDVRLVAGGQTILDDVALQIEPGSHVAIVGPSGAGKSSLVGALLGWHTPASGRILVDSKPLDTLDVQAVRAETAWVDPGITLWNDSIFANLRYGAEGADHDLSCVLGAADLRALLQTLPAGLQTPLGEGGGLVSGGEGQRVRLGRALSRKSARLVILDEPFRGLDRPTRRALLTQARAWWPDATLLCITHDVAETLEFARVLVVAEGRILEDGPPERLASSAESRYAAMLAAERQVASHVWQDAAWRRLLLIDGKLSHEAESVS